MILAIGPGDASRIYRTTDGGATWEAAFVNDDPAAFYDCMAFYPGGRHGLVMGDPVDGKFRILATHDSGRSWHVLPDDAMPAAPTEYGFAASGDCLVTAGHSAYFGSGGGAARVFRSDDRGLTWTATDSTIPAGEAAGCSPWPSAGRGTGIAVGGDFAEPADGVDAVATTRDGDAWRSAGDLTHLAEDVAVPARPASRADRHRRVRRRAGHEHQHRRRPQLDPGRRRRATTPSTARPTAPAGPPAAAVRAATRP